MVKFPFRVSSGSEGGGDVRDACDDEEEKGLCEDVINDSDKDIFKCDDEEKKEEEEKKDEKKEEDETKREPFAIVIFDLEDEGTKEITQPLSIFFQKRLGATFTNSFHDYHTMMACVRIFKLSWSIA